MSFIVLQLIIAYWLRKNRLHRINFSMVQPAIPSHTMTVSCVELITTYCGLCRQRRRRGPLCPEGITYSVMDHYSVKSVSGMNDTYYKKFDPAAM